MAYTYDGDGNRRSVGSKTYQYNARDQLVNDGTHTYGYDADGTLSSETTTATGSDEVFAYDAYQQMATDAGTSYTYDALGRTTSAGSTALQYSGQGNEVASDGNAAYTHDPDGTVVGAWSPGGGSEVTWTDQHDNLVAQFTPSAGGLSEWQTFDPLGDVASSVNWSVSLGYQSGYTSGGKVNMDSRWYSPASGQFDSADTQSNSPNPSSANANQYTYANDNPLTGIDMSGHDSCPGDCGDPGGDFGDQGDSGGDGSSDVLVSMGGASENETIANFGTQLEAQSNWDSSNSSLNAQELEMESELTQFSQSELSDVSAKVTQERLNGGRGSLTAGEEDMLADFAEDLEEVNNQPQSVGQLQSYIQIELLYRGYLAFLDGPSTESECIDEGSCIAWGGGNTSDCHGTSCNGPGTTSRVGSPSLHGPAGPPPPPPPPQWLNNRTPNAPSCIPTASITCTSTTAGQANLRSAQPGTAFVPQVAANTATALSTQAGLVPDAKACANAGGMVMFQNPYCGTRITNQTKRDKDCDKTLRTQLSG